MRRVQAINSFIPLIVLILVMLVSAPVEASDLPAGLVETFEFSNSTPYNTTARITVIAAITAVGLDTMLISQISQISQAPAQGQTADQIPNCIAGNGNDPAIKVNAGKMQGC